MAFVAVDKGATGAVEDTGTSAAGVAFQDLVAAEELGGLRKIAAHSVGLRWVGGIDIDGCWLRRSTIVVVRDSATELILLIDHQTIEQGVVYAIELYLLIAEQQSYKDTILHHRTEVT